MIDLTNNFLEEIAELDEGWQEFLSVPVSELQFENGTVSLYEQTFDYTQPAMLSLLKQLNLDEYNGSVTKVVEYFFANRGIAEENAVINRHVQSLNNIDVTINVRVHNGRVYGFDTPVRFYAKGGEVAVPFITSIGETATIVEYSVSPERITVVAILQEYESREHYGIGVKLVHPLIGSRKTVLTGLIQQTSCSNSIQSAFDVGIFNNAAFVSRYVFMLRSVQSLVVETMAEVYKLEALDRVAITPEDFVRFLGVQNIRLNDQQLITMLEGTRGDKETLHGMINGLTYVAHMNSTDGVQRQKLEILAGRVVNNPSLYGFVPTPIEEENDEDEEENDEDEE